MSSYNTVIICAIKLFVFKTGTGISNCKLTKKIVFQKGRIFLALIQLVINNMNFKLSLKLGYKLPKYNNYALIQK